MVVDYDAERILPGSDSDDSSTTKLTHTHRMRLPIACLMGVIAGAFAALMYKKGTLSSQPFSDDLVELPSAGESACGGQTPETTDWKDYVPNGIFVDVDTSKCGFAATPNYFTSLGGHGHQWRSTGSAEVYSATPTGFRIYIHREAGLDAAKAKTWKWHINWIGAGNPTKNVGKLCTGVSDSSKWVNYAASSIKSIYVDVDTSKCGYKGTPTYVTSMGGSSNHWTTHGSSEIYVATPKGFRIYIVKPDVDIDPKYAKDRKWAVNWIALGDAGDKDPCSGNTPPHSTKWVPYIKGGLYVDVDTSKCGFKTTPQYISSMGGDSNFWLTEGSTQIYKASPTGFRAYIYKKDLTPAQADSLGWYMRWITAVPSSAVPSSAGPSSSGEFACGGQTPSVTNWHDYVKNAIYVDVDTSKCGFATTPKYFTSLGGSGHQWRSTGSAEVYSPTRTGFRLYIHREAGLNAAQAKTWKWHINWIGAGNPTKNVGKLCTGVSDYSKWVNYAASSIKSIYVDVDTSKCGYKGTPTYVTSMGGSSNHWTTHGTSEIYVATPKGFRIYVVKPDVEIDPKYAKDRKWAVNWIALGDAGDADPCSGSTSPHSTTWVQYIKDGVYADIDTSNCGFKTTPQYISSFGGDQIWTTEGSTQIYKASPTSFRIYIYKKDITTAQATSLGWYVKWTTAVTSLAPAPAPTASPTRAPTRSPTQQTCSPPPECKLSFHKVSHSNLGGQGPDSGVAELRFDSVCKVAGTNLDLVVKAVTEYTVNNNKANGLSGQYGQINVLGGTQVDLQFQFVKQGTLDVFPIASTAFTIFDLDGNKNSGAYQRVVVTGLDHYVLTSGSTVVAKELSTTPYKMSFDASEDGNAADNPTDPMKLTQLQKRRTVSIQFSQTGSFVMGFAITGPYANGGRNFVFAGKSSIDKPPCR